MQRITSYLLCAGLFAPSLLAQAGPGMLDADTNSTGQQNMVRSTYFTSVNNSATTLWDITPAIWTTAGRSITQVSTGKTGMAGLGKGEFHMCFTSSLFTTNYVNAANSGSGDVILGKVTWNSGAPVFTPTNLAANLNSTGNDFGLMIDGKDGTRAALDWPAGPYWSKRTSNGVAFPKPVPLTGAGGSYVDPAPGHMGGVLGCFWVSSGTTMSWAPVNETLDSNGNVTAAALVTASTVTVIQSSNQPHSPTPQFYSNGDTTSMWYSRVSSGDSDQYWSSQLPDLTGGIQVHDTSAWSNNGGIAGSYFLCAYSGHYNTLLEGRGSHMGCTSDIKVQTGATLDIHVSGPVGTPPLSTTRLAVALKVGTPVVFPGIVGVFGLDLATLAIITGGPTISDTDETAYVSFPATDPGLVTLKSIGIQFLTIPLAGQPAFTSTGNPSFK